MASVSESSNFLRHPWRLAELTLTEVQATAWSTAVIPLGATEPHNTHLPYGTDSFEAQVIGDAACQLAWNQGARVILLPTLPYGTETNLRGFPLAINWNPSTVQQVLGDLVDSLIHSGIRKIVLLNSHGGNDLKPVLREFYGSKSAHLFLFNWYQAIADVAANLLEQADDHAGEMETSVALAYFEHLVAREPGGGLRADAGEKRPTRFEALNRGWVGLTRPWHLLTTSSGAGNPHAASADKGRQVVAAAAERLASFLVPLAAADPDDPQFPY